MNNKSVNSTTFVGIFDPVSKGSATGFCIFVLLLALFSYTNVRANAPGVTSNEIVFGQSAPLSGPTQAIGNSLRIGINVAFDEINEAGGVDSRSLKLLSIDDRYEPARAAANTRSLIESHQILALVGSAGTPTTKLSIPIATEANVPFIAPLTGAEFLRDPVRFPTVVNLRPSYFQETEAWIEYLLSIGVKRIAVFYQDDSFGRIGLRGIRDSLAKHDLLIVARSSYARNLTVVSSAVFDLRRAMPEAIAMIATPRTSSEFIRQLHSLGFSPILLNLSILSTRSWVEQLGSESHGVIISQVLPSPWEQSPQLVVDFKRAMSRYATSHVVNWREEKLNQFSPEPKEIDAESLIDFISLEGYLAGRFLIEALGRIDGEPTREALLNAIFQTGEFDIGGINIRFEPGSNQGLHYVYLTNIDESMNFKPVFSVDIRDLENNLTQ